MNHIAKLLCLAACIGCGQDTPPIVAGRVPDSDVEDGGTATNVGREKAEAFLTSLVKVQTAAEERELLTEFAQWLTENDLKIRVELRNEKHVLSCPYFPPVTPVASHSFLDIDNLNLLPRLDESD